MIIAPRCWPPTTPVSARVPCTPPRPCRLAAPRHHGRPFRPQHFVRPASRQGHPPADKNIFRRPPHVFEAEILLEPFAQAGADEMIIHVELGDHVPALIWKIKSLGKKVGLAINPPTAIAEVEPFLEKLICCFVMTVNRVSAGRNSSTRRCQKSSRRRRGGWKGNCPTASAWTAELISRRPRNVRAPGRIRSWRARACSASAA